MATENGLKAPEQDEDRRPTERVILQRVRAITLPETVDPEQIAAAVDLLYPKAKRAEREGAVADGWVEVSRQTAPSKKAAIEAYAGKAGTADAKVGEFRAPSVTAWKGGVRHERPPAPLIQAEMFE